MIRLSAWVVTLSDGSTATVRPLTVRERIATTEAFAGQCAERASADARLAGMASAEVFREVTTARRNARTASALVMDCFTLDGAMRVLHAASVDAERIAAGVEPKELSWIALEALGVDREDADGRTDAGNA